jgi:hypothetical protein
VDNRKKSVNDFMRNIFDRMKTHGMGLPSGVDLNEALARVTIDCTGPDPEQVSVDRKADIIGDKLANVFTDKPFSFIRHSNEPWALHETTLLGICILAVS